MLPFRKNQDDGVGAGPVETLERKPDDEDAEYANLLFRRWEDLVGVCCTWFVTRQGAESIQAPWVAPDYDDDGSADREMAREQMEISVRALTAVRIAALREADQKVREEQERTRQEASAKADEARRRAEYEKLKTEFESAS